MCRVWYRGQPLICHLCKEEGHRAAVCPGGDKCRRCGEAGYMARHCPNPWGIAGRDALVPGTGNSPAQRGKIEEVVEVLEVGIRPEMGEGISVSSWRDHAL